MEKTFNTKKYIEQLAEELVTNFGRASLGTSPDAIGEAREEEVRKKLALIFPPSIGVGTGFIIDSYENTSKQTDLVLYEKSICPIFSINGAIKSSYYPCESVIAAGEIKSTLGKKELEDSILKIKSIKLLKRFYTSDESFRSYGNTLTITAYPTKYSQSKNTFDQIFTFILCEKFGFRIETLIKYYEEIFLSEPDKNLLPNMILSLNEGILAYRHKDKSVLDPNLAEAFSFYRKKEGRFKVLLSALYDISTRGRTTNILPYQRYLLDEIDS